MSPENKKGEPEVAGKVYKSSEKNIMFLFSKLEIKISKSYIFNIIFIKELYLRLIGLFTNKSVQDHKIFK